MKQEMKASDRVKLYQQPLHLPQPKGGKVTIDVENVNRSFPKYPMTVDDKGWVYGVWYCGTSWHKSRIYGEYPPTFLKRALALFPAAQNILHCPSGLVEGPGITVDAQRYNENCPQIVANATDLPFEDQTFDLVLSDPPYTDKDAEQYGTGHYPTNKAMKEFWRILRPGGYFGQLHLWYPSYQRKFWHLKALIAVITGFCKRTRVFSVFERMEEVGDVKGLFD